MNQVIQEKIAALTKPLAKYGIAGFKMKLLFSDRSTFELASPLKEGVPTDSQISVIAIERLHNECSFIFEGIGVGSSSTHSHWREKDKDKFALFCIQFVDAMLDVIIEKNPDYRFSFILNNKRLRDAVIRQEYLDMVTFSEREQLCLLLAAQGKKTKVIAKELNISPHTVEQYLKRIRTSLNCDNLIQAMFESIQRGLIGKINPISINQYQQ
ncbi:lipolytic enzyme / transcription regulator protein [Legionella nautarum]|uniref:Lipolytic enzyme / transcription regulator protein n=1 Tax=Legionella nautarum TaxID=45070 RepID=A0A0W0WIN2_9GAMM|nr:helix-turn-helix transcriptional regulator [Legionella nautarum]KTD32191.1 lipolytic enzyme / transcription regulator protein [Legionella nautarum]